ncbi:MAG: SurA N-terminal domain-containing protein [Lachnospiraceae bacterium]|nr:SurA N-terminal domain-containing protein [Lachnospiraceae bacterium]
MSKRRNKKKSIWPKILIFVAILVLAAVIFGRKGEEKEKETVWQEGSMLRIGENQVDYREGMVYLNAVQKDYEQYYGSDIWKYAIDSEGNTMGDIIKEQMLEQMIYIKVVCRKADELGIVLSEEELQQVDRQTEEYMAELQNSSLLLHGVNEDIVRRIYSDNLLARKTFEAITLNVDTDIPDEEAAQHKFYTIAIRNFKINSSGNRVSYEGTEQEELRARVESLRKQGVETEDFYKLAAANTEDSTMLEITAGKGDFPKEYEDTVLALTENQVSEVIETTDYYYIFYCVTDFDVDATHAKKEEIIADRQEKEFQTRYKEWRGTTHIEVNEEIWDALDFDMESVG